MIVWRCAILHIYTGQSFTHFIYLRGVSLRKQTSHILTSRQEILMLRPKTNLSVAHVENSEMERTQLITFIYISLATGQKLTIHRSCMLSTKISAAIREINPVWGVSFVLEKCPLGRRAVLRFENNRAGSSRLHIRQIEQATHISRGLRDYSSFFVLSNPAHYGTHRSSNHWQRYV